MKIAAALVLALAGTAMAQTIDGSRDGSYTSLFNQNVQTQFGDNESELDNLSWSSDGVNLYLFVGGNLQNNGNRMSFFFGTSNPGQNTLSGMPGTFGNNQITFDSAMGNVSRMITVNHSNTDQLYTNVLSFNGGAWSEEYAGNSTTGAMGFTPNGTSGVQALLNNSNTAGVTGGTGTFDPAVSGLVSTGMELVIPLAWLGYSGGVITVAGFVNNGDHNYASNQFIGGFEGSQGNLGGDGNGGFTGVNNWDLNDFDGEQFVRIVPTPGAAGLLGLGALALGRRRR
jgi:hypothetical protein